MPLQRYWLTTGAAVVAALGVGFGAARWIDHSPPAAKPAENDHAEDEGDGAVVALTLEQAAQAGVAVVAPQRGGGAELKLPGRVSFVPGAEAAVAVTVDHAPLLRGADAAVGVGE